MDCKILECNSIYKLLNDDYLLVTLLTDTLTHLKSFHLNDTSIFTRNERLTKPEKVKLLVIYPDWTLNK